MTSINHIISDSKCEDLHCITDNGTSKFLCFTRLDKNNSNFIICVSDSVDVWKLDLDKDELEVLADLANTNLDAYLSKLRSGFQTGDLQVSQMGVKINLVVGSGSKSLNYDLYEAKAIDKKIEIQNVLFRLAEKATDLESKLEKANNDLEVLRKQKGNAGANAVIGLDLDGAKSGKNQPKAAPKQVGMSVVNPSSKKRKVATGVNFD